ncbi:MAG: hypothetical protein AB1644_03395 [Candidatus Zixiibacteriota bacterium]
MRNTMSSSTARLILVGFILATVAVYALVATSCSDRVSGTRFQNQPPVVQFVNVPPDGVSTSRNPVVYWFGTDADGQVKVFRYIVRTVTELNGRTPEEFARDSLPGYDSSKFVYLTVTVEEPKTANTVKMSADLSDPVRQYVQQYIFLQAIDDLGAGSAFVWKMMFRNDNPPQAFVSVLQGTTINDPFINSVFPGGAITGVRIGWRGEDLIDYPSDAPPFEFRWKFFGPYAYDTASSSDELDQLRAQFVKKIFVSTDAQVYFVGNNDTIFRCDTTFVPPNVVITCDTLLVDTVTKESPYGRLDSILTVDDPAFTSSPFYKVVDSSPGWLTTTRDSFFNVFKDAPSAETREETFVFWVTCRDDASVEDLAPSYQILYVLDPKFERDVLVIDFTKLSIGARYNAPVRGILNSRDTTVDTARNYWANVIRKWNPSIDYSKAKDYLYPNGQSDRIDLQQVLRYKLLILYNDNVTKSGISTGVSASEMGEVIYTAIDAGVNAWLTMRTPIDSKPDYMAAALPQNPPVDAQYQRYFGVQTMIYSGWLPMAIQNLFYPTPPQTRIEDFVGAYSLQTNKWPDLSIDTTLLHRRIYWTPVIGGALAWRDTIASLPEVDWTSRSFGTEPMFLYKSRFGSRGHFLGDLFTFDGTPVAHRLDAGLFRTVHFNFTPLAMDTIAMQVVIDSVLNWLFDEYLQAPPTATRYPGAAIQMSVDDVRRNFEARQQQMREQAAWRHQHPSDF